MEFTQGHALVIGVGTHQYLHESNNIPVSAADAEAVKAVLCDSEKCGYLPENVTLLHDGSATKSGIVAALDHLANPAIVKEEDTVFIFYCGHGGFGTDNKYYLVSHDAIIEHGRVAKGTGLSEQELIQHIQRIHARRVLMIFNACWSGNLSQVVISTHVEHVNKSSPTVNEPGGMVKNQLLSKTSRKLLRTGDERFVITASSEYQQSHTGLGELTIFTQALVDGLSGIDIPNKGGHISVYDLFEQIYNTVTSKTAQQPELTVWKGRGPFPVALHPSGKNDVLFDVNQRAPEKGVQQISQLFILQAFEDSKEFLNNKLWEVQEKLSGYARVNIVIGVLIAAVVITILLMMALPPKQTTMHGYLNVAVANFGTLDDHGKMVKSDDGVALAQSFCDNLGVELGELNNELGKEYTIKLQGPAEVGKLSNPPTLCEGNRVPIIQGSTPEEREENAAELARKVNADVVIYGHYERKGDEMVFIPEFYISPAILSDAEELSGRFQVSPDIPVGTETAQNREASPRISDTMQKKANSLSWFIVGLVKYNNHDYETARTYFDKALGDKALGESGNLEEDNFDPEQDELKKVYYLFKGKSYAVDGKWDLALEQYELALEIDHQYARTLLGKADVLYQESRGQCQANSANQTGIENAIILYQEALRAADQAVLSDIELKVAFLLGRAYWCLSRAGFADQWDEAEQQTQRVIDAYNQGNTLIQKLASEAHANLGLIYWTKPSSDSIAKTNNLQSAAQEYLLAIQLQEWKARQGIFHSYLAQIYEELHEYDKADAQWEEAKKLDPANKPEHEQWQTQLQPLRTPTPDSTEEK